MNLLLSPHPDDETLFAAFTIQREKPLVVICTLADVQFIRGDGITPEMRNNECIRAMNILGAPVVFLNIKESTFDTYELQERLKHFNATKVYAPALQGGHKHHDAVSIAADRVFGDKVVHYTTYEPGKLWTTGTIEVVPTEEEQNIKYKAMTCYQSQIELPATLPHFQAVVGKSEWLI